MTKMSEMSNVPLKLYKTYEKTISDNFV